MGWGWGAGSGGRCLVFQAIPQAWAGPPPLHVLSDAPRFYSTLDRRMDRWVDGYTVVKTCITILDRKSNY